jgi:hypothetical protein
MGNITITVWRGLRAAGRYLALVIEAFREARAMSLAMRHRHPISE